jgi:hypothetical protein
MNIEKLKQKIGKPAIMKWAYHFALKVWNKINIQVTRHD